MILAVVRDLRASGERPPRDLVAGASSRTRRQAGTTAPPGSSTSGPTCSRASPRRSARSAASRHHVGGRRAYLLQTAEKGTGWLRLVAHGRAGHGSQVNDDNAVTRLCRGRGPARARTPGRCRSHRPCGHSSPAVDELTGVGLDPEDPDALVETARADGPDSSAPPCAPRPTRRCSTAGYKHNVIPGEAAALIDGRFLPGHEEQFVETVGELAGTDVERRDGARASRRWNGPSRATSSTRWWRRCRPRTRKRTCCRTCLSGGTDNKALARLGIAGYGFAPLRLPPDWTSPACSTASTSASRSTPCGSGSAPCHGSCAPADDRS